MLPKPNRVVTTTLSRDFYYGTISAFIAKLNAEGERASWQSLSLTAMQQFVDEDEWTGGKLRAQFPQASIAEFMRSGRDPTGTTQTTRVPSADYERLEKFCQGERTDGVHWTLQWLSTAAVVWYLRKQGVDV